MVEGPGPLRVLHLTTEFPPVIFGGLGTAVGGWVTASSRAGITVAVELVEGALVLTEGEPMLYGSPRSRSEATEKGIVGPTGVTFFQASWADAAEAAVRLVHSWHPDVIHLHTAMLWQVGRALQDATQIPLVFHVHSVDRAEYEIGEEPNQWLVHSEQELAIRSADRLIALSLSERDLLDHYYPEVVDRVRVVGNGVDELADATDVGKTTPATDTVVLYSGRLVERKGIRDLLAAIPDVLDAAPKTKFVLAGGPPAISGDDLRRLWTDPALTPCADRVAFTGWLSPARVADWYRRADILVVPSRYEPFGMVVLEGMLHGLAIVASASGGPAEILEDGRTGLLFPPRSVETLAQRILLLVKDSGLRAQLGAAAAADVRHRWLWSQQVRRMRSVYEELTRAA